MAADYTALAIYDLNAYVWQSLQNAGLLTKTDYWQEASQLFFVPIILGQQIPEFNNLLPGKTYIVYDWDLLPPKENWWISEEVVSYQIMSSNPDKGAAIANFLKDLLQRYDDSAKDFRNSTVPSTKFNFLYTSIEKSGSPEPSKYEAGTTTTHVAVYYCYTRDLTSGRF